MEINLKGKGDKDDGLTPSKSGSGLSEQTARVIVQVFLKFRVVLSPRIRRRKPAIKPGGCLDIITLTDRCGYPQNRKCVLKFHCLIL